MAESRLSRPPLGSELSLAVSTPEVMAPSKLDFENTATIKTQGSAPLSVDNGSISVPISKPKTKRKSRLDLSALLKKDVVALQQKKLEASSGTVPPLYNLRSDVTSVKTEPTDSLVSHSEKVDLNVHNSTTPKQPMHSMTMPQPFQNATKLPEIIDLTMDDSDVEIYSAPVIQQEAEVKMDVDVEQDHYMDIGSGAVAYNVHDHTDIQPIAIEDGYKADVSTIFDTTNPDTIVTRSIPESSTKSLFPEENNVAGNDSVAVVPFGSQMKVIAIQNGLENASKISIRFEMPDTLFSQLSKWVHRHFDTQSLQNSLCLSLACYSSSEILERINEGIHHSQEELVSSLQSFWPTSGGLSMSMPLTQAVEEFPLSPPFMVTQDGFVDVSQFVSVGQNAIELSHQTELSNHTFVLYVHNPTQSQLQQITEQRDNEQQWETWAQHISRPFAES
ncbi:hypothetical protein BDQ17DRAFT_1357826 [Cyathus striatus]|nr:hypothetical protein BDQ17DRAFT_1357826 [Cyathus striatus]